MRFYRKFLLIFILFLSTSFFYTKDIVKIIYHGHSCFSVITPKKLSIMIDPFSKKLGYKMPRIPTHVVLISNEHYGHNDYKDVVGVPIILHGINKDGSFNKIDFYLQDVHIFNLPSYHDKVRGNQWGLNSIFVIDIENFRIIHMGSFGSFLYKKELNKLYKPNILMIPVGGFFTIDANDAYNLCKKIKPDIIMPMNYKTEVTKDLPFNGVEDFLKLFPENKIFHPKKRVVKFNLDKNYGKGILYLMKYK